MIISNCSSNTNGAWVTLFGADGHYLPVHLAPAQRIETYGVFTLSGPVSDTLTCRGSVLVVDGDVGANATFVSGYPPQDSFFGGMALALGLWMGLGAVRMARKAFVAGLLVELLPV